MELRRFNGELIGVGDTLIEIVKANLSDLSGSNLSGSDLSGSNLSGSDLSGSNLSGSDLSGSNLRGSNLRGSNLSGSDLRGSDLSGSDLRGSNLSGSKIEFPFFPSVSQLASMSLGELPDDITLELMRRDAYGHPHPERFDVWAKGGNCPYQNEQRAWFFSEKRKLWKPGNPTMADRDLVFAICKTKGWGIREYLPLDSIEKD